MGKPKKVIIHQIQDSLTNLEDSLDYFEPDYVFLLSSEFYSKDKPDMALMEIKNKNARALGNNVSKIEYSELVTIKDAWHKTTMLDVYEIFGEIKSKCQEMAGKDGCVFYSGLADGPALITSGIAFASVLHQMQTYFTRGRRTYYNREYVLEIDNLNKITNVKNWLEHNIMNRRNIRYLKHIIEFEERGVVEIGTKDLEGVMSETTKAINSALKKLEKYELIRIDGKRNRKITSTQLGRLTVNLGLGGIG
jgi:hypothetical protein